MGIEDKISKGCKIAAMIVGLGIIVVGSSTIGPNKKEKVVPIIPETRKVASVCSESERKQIKKLEDDAYFVMITRTSDEHFVSDRVINQMLNNYSAMSSEVRKKVKGDMENSLFYYWNDNGKEMNEFYRKKAEELGLNYIGSELVPDPNFL